MPADYPKLGSPDWQLVPSGPEWPEWMDEPGYLAAPSEDDPGEGELEEYEDPDNAPPPGLDDAQLAALIAEAREVTAEQAGAEAERPGPVRPRSWLRSGRWRPGGGGRGCPGRRESFPGSSRSPAAGFASGKPLDIAPGGPVLAQFADEAAGEGDRYPGCLG